jgi:predicted MFS family arabinose efflux permease
MLKKSNLKGPSILLLAGLTSPCCAPLIVPVLLALVAGTPAAVWISQHLGWVYGVLTVISLLSLVLAVRWMGRHRSLQPAAGRPSKSPGISSLVGEHAHVE